MAEQKLTAEESFRKALEDVVAIAEKLEGVFPTTEALCIACKDAIGNDSCLLLMMDKVTQGKR